MSEKQFHGDGYKDDPIKGQEAARHRHMFSEIDKSWVPIDQNTLSAMKDGGTVIQAIRIISSMLKVGGPVAIAGLAAGAFAKTQGWI